MLCAFAALYFLHVRVTRIGAVPLSNTTALLPPQQMGTGLSVQQSECVSPLYRTEWDILWSCLVTIFACSWVSVHPNITPGKGWKKRSLPRLELMFWSVICPEYLIAWAAEQWVVARHLANNYAKDGWTMTHGYFIQMGGFNLYDGDQRLGELGPNHLEYLLQNRMITMPAISEEEIQDKSKGNGLSKALVIVQTTWFITQCIARKSQGLLITELELATLAFAALNGLMCFFWWNKPLDIRTTVPVYINFSTGLTEVKPIREAVLHDEKSTNIVQSQDSRLHGQDSHQDPKIASSVDDGSIYNGAARIYKGSLEPNGADVINQEATATGQAHSVGNRREVHRENSFNGLRIHRTWGIVVSTTSRWPIAVLNRRIANIMPSDTTKPPISIAGRNITLPVAPDVMNRREKSFQPSVFPIVGILFGLIHCAGWNFFFLSLFERNLWRISSVVIVGVPAIKLVSLFPMKGFYLDPENFQMPVVLKKIMFLIHLSFPFYFIARLSLLAVALVSLRDLPLGASALVRWTSLIPHI